MDEVGAVVIGAGVVGLACARALARMGRDVLIIERNSSFGAETSSRSSEVIHAGIYYPRDSLKARLCVAGRELLYQFCETHEIAHRRCGKLIVATNNAQEVMLESIRQRALANGVSDLQLLSANEAQVLEPALACRSALLSPSTGIVDSHALMLALLGDAEKTGAVIVTNTSVVGVKKQGRAFVVSTDADGHYELSTSIVVNAAGHYAPTVARCSPDISGSLVPAAYLAKGNYFSISGKSPFSRLIYPVPVPGGLGVHLTLDLSGSARFGPDVEWVDTFDYQVSAERVDMFYEQIEKYWPGIQRNALQPAYAGIRPKIVPQGAVDADFVIQGPKDHGVIGLVNLFGIESPGLTSALAIAEVVTNMLNVGDKVTSH